MSEVRRNNGDIVPKHKDICLVPDIITALERIRELERFDMRNKIMQENKKLKKVVAEAKQIIIKVFTRRCMVCDREGNIFDACSSILQSLKQSDATHEE